MNTNVFYSIFFLIKRDKKWVDVLGLYTGGVRGGGAEEKIREWDNE